MIQNKTHKPKQKFLKIFSQRFNKLSKMISQTIISRQTLQFKTVSNRKELNIKAQKAQKYN